MVCVAETARCVLCGFCRVFTPAATGANLKRLAGCIGLSILGSSANVLIGAALS